jgi:hypothetical protein
MIYIDNQPPSTLVRICVYQHPEKSWMKERHWIWDWQDCPAGIIRN